MNLAALTTPIAAIPHDLPAPLPDCPALALLRQYQPASVRTIAHRSGIDAKSLSQRFRRLEEAGSVFRAGTERGSRGGCVAIVWRAA